MRTCVGCRRQAGQDELVRVRRRPDGTLAGRPYTAWSGAWLCAGSLGCVQRAARRNALTRALRAPVSPEAVLALGQDGSDDRRDRARSNRADLRFVRGWTAVVWPAGRSAPKTPLKD